MEKKLNYIRKKRQNTTSTLISQAKKNELYLTKLIQTNEDIKNLLTDINNRADANNLKLPTPWQKFKNRVLGYLRALSIITIIAAAITFIIERKEVSYSRTLQSWKALEEYNSNLIGVEAFKYLSTMDCIGLERFQYFRDNILENGYLTKAMKNLFCSRLSWPLNGIKIGNKDSNDKLPIKYHSIYKTELSKSDFNNIEFLKLSTYETFFIESVFFKSNFIRTRDYNANLSNASYLSSFLLNHFFVNTYGKNVNFKDTKFDSVRFINSDFRESKFVDSTLTDVYFTDSDLSHSTFEETTIEFDLHSILNMFNGTQLDSVDFRKTRWKRNHTINIENINFFHPKIPKYSFKSWVCTMISQGINWENAMYSDNLDCTEGFEVIDIKKYASMYPGKNNTTSFHIDYYDL
ncbi:pentapeptide repeat-containing protein [Vibrio vulnificus]|uniref:pentapeptide repeat-containing protein n=1 Tax=Vibrio vulnificus TaxID=672 RepID=UPI001CDB9D9D|nr:pentapeptide repeat-containing protein [Vibrio vulnificus]MCA4015374.1 pentapeptide repeat-containing protein [Vibrio vulnificus]